MNKRIKEIIIIALASFAGGALITFIGWLLNNAIFG